MAAQSNDTSLSCRLSARPAPRQTTPGAAGDSQLSAAQLDQVAIITGCASGIGRGTALAFANLNYKLVLVDKQADRLAETASLCAQKSSKNYKVSVITSH